MSSIPSVASNDLTNLLHSTSSTKPKKPGGKIDEDFDTLQTTLTSGDLTAAKTAFATLQTDFKNGSSKGPDLSALESALNSGDLTAAKTALSDLQKNKPARNGGNGQGSTKDVSGTNATNGVDAFLQSLQGTSSSSSTSSAVGASKAADPFGISGQNVDFQA